MYSHAAMNLNVIDGRMDHGWYTQACLMVGRYLPVVWLSASANLEFSSELEGTPHPVSRNIAFISCFSDGCDRRKGEVSSRQSHGKSPRSLAGSFHRIVEGPYRVGSSSRGKCPHPRQYMLLCSLGFLEASCP